MRRRQYKYKRFALTIPEESAAGETIRSICSMPPRVMVSSIWLHHWPDPISFRSCHTEIPAKIRSSRSWRAKSQSTREYEMNRQGLDHEGQCLCGDFRLSTLRDLVFHRLKRIGSHLMPFFIQHGDFCGLPQSQSLAAKRRRCRCTVNNGHGLRGPAPLVN
jgi:hypothetical protein